MRRPAWIAILALAATSGAGCGKEEPDLSKLEGRNYYLLEAGYTCTPMAPGSAPVASYRDSIRFSKGFVCQTGDSCNDLVQCADPDESAVKVSEDLSTVEYGGKTFTYSSAPPI